MTDRLFLDANILFSVAYMSDSGLGKFWKLDDVELLTSEYAIAEARRNLDNERQIKTLQDRLESVNVVPTPSSKKVELPVDLPEKDQPILKSALYANATHLLTGDKADFGKWFGQEIRATKILRPASYLQNE